MIIENPVKQREYEFKARMAKKTLEDWYYGEMERVEKNKKKLIAKYGEANYKLYGGKCKLVLDSGAKPNIKNKNPKKVSHGPIEVELHDTDATMADFEAGRM